MMKNQLQWVIQFHQNINPHLKIIELEDEHMHRRMDSSRIKLKSLVRDKIRLESKMQRPVQSYPPLSVSRVKLHLFLTSLKISSK